MLKSWLGSSAEKLKKQSSEKTCLRGNSDGAGIGHFIIRRCCFHILVVLHSSYFEFANFPFSIDVF